MSEVLKTLPKAHYEWLMKVKEDMQLPDIDVMIKLGSTTTQPHAAIKACIEEKVPLFCSGLGNPGFMVADAHNAGMKVLGISGNTKNAADYVVSAIIEAFKPS